MLGVNAVGCSSGDTLANEQEEAATKQDVLKALGKAASSLRGKLGESLATVQKFDVPVEATTPSLEALKLTAWASPPGAPRAMLKPFRSTNAPLNWTPILPWPMPAWARRTPTSARPAWRPKHQESLRAARSGQRARKIPHLGFLLSERHW